MNQDELHLLHGYLDDTITDGDFPRLQVLLRESVEARRMLRSLCTIDTKLLECAAAADPAILRLMTASGAQQLEDRSQRAFHGWLKWRPLTASAAGMVLGLFCTSMLWAIAAPRAVVTAERLLALVDGGFENGRADAGFPRQVGVWSGDASEIVVAESVKAREGRRMLRFVKAEADANNPGGQAISCDVFQLVDLRALRESEGARGDSVLELSAEFLDARAANTNPSVTFLCQMFLFHGDPSAMSATWPVTIHEAISSGSAQTTTLGAGGWRRVTARCLAPAEADFAVVQLAARPNLRVPMPSALFADDVKLTLKTQPALPVRVVQR
jgi:hypothetical protein